MKEARAVRETCWGMWDHNRHLNDGHHLENHKGDVRMLQKGVQGAREKVTKDRVGGTVWGQYNSNPTSLVCFSPGQRCQSCTLLPPSVSQGLCGLAQGSE